MVSAAPPVWRTVALFGVILVSTVLLARVLPIPDTPFFLGAVIAVVYWLVKTRTKLGEG